MSLAIDAAPLGTQAFSAGFFYSGTAIRTFSDADCSKMYSLSRAVQGVLQIGAMGGRNSLDIAGWSANSRWATCSLTKGDTNPGPNRFRPRKRTCTVQLRMFAKGQ